MGEFDPSKYLTKIQGSDYLEVKWRLVWLRADHPGADIETRLEIHTDKIALFKATITIPEGGSATGWGSETPGDFRDYIEKAETKAIGRALGALGYGTQFTPDFDFGSANGRVVDSPIDRSRLQGNGAAPANNNKPTERQLNFLQSQLRSNGFGESETRQLIASRTKGGTIDQLDKSTVSKLIEELKAGSLRFEDFAAPGEPPAPTVDQETGEILDKPLYVSSWTEFWENARAIGLPNKQAVSEYVGFDIGSITDATTLWAEVQKAKEASALTPEVPF